MRIKVASRPAGQKNNCRRVADSTLGPLLSDRDNFKIPDMNVRLRHKKKPRMQIEIYPKCLSGLNNSKRAAR
jgi:hypothetical protein